MRGWEGAQDIEALTQATVSMGTAHKVILKTLVLGIICAVQFAPMAESIPTAPNWVELDFTDPGVISTTAAATHTFSVPLNYVPGVSSLQVDMRAESSTGEASDLLNANGNGLAVTGGDDTRFDTGEKLKFTLTLNDNAGNAVCGYGIRIYRVGYSHMVNSTGKSIDFSGGEGNFQVTTSGLTEVVTSLESPYSLRRHQELVLTSQGSDEPFQLQSLGLTVVPLLVPDAYEPSNAFIYDGLEFSSSGVLVNVDNTQTIRTSGATGSSWGGYNAGSGSIQAESNQLNIPSSANVVGSYVYSIFSVDTASIDLSGHEATFKIQATRVSHNQKLRWMVRNGAGAWFLSDETWEPTLTTYSDERHLTAFPVSRNTWQAIDNNTAINQFGNRSVPLALGANATPDLSQVTGFGIYISGSNGNAPLTINGFRLSEYEGLIYYHPGKASHWFNGPNNLQVGISDMTGACFNEMYWNTPRNAIAAMNGRQCQYAFRSFYHNGKWNPTQAGHDEFYGMPTPIATTVSSVGSGIRYEWGPTPIANWHGDGQFDVAENEDLSQGHPYRDRAGWENRDFQDDDGLDESDLTQAIEVISDFDQGGFVEDVSSLTEEPVLALRLNLYQDFARLGHNTLQFNENAIAYDRQRTPGSARNIISGAWAAADLSSILPGSQPSTATDMTRIPYRWADRLDVLEANFRYLWNYDSDSRTWTIHDLVVNGGESVEAPPNSAYSIVADSGNPNDAKSCQAVALYFPPWSELNQYPIVGIDRKTGTKVYRENRVLSTTASAAQATKGGWSGPENDISSEFTKRIIGVDYTGILSPDHTPEGVYERLRQEIFWIFGTPEDLVRSIPDIESHFTSLPMALPGPAHLKTMPGSNDFTNGSVDVPANQGLRWWPAIGAETYHVYLGTDQTIVASANTGSDSFLGTTTTNSFPDVILESHTTYYWRVDALNAAGLTVGDVWKFTTSEALIYDPEISLTFNLGDGARSDGIGSPSNTIIMDNVLIGNGPHEVHLTITGYAGNATANIQKVPNGITANGLAVVAGNARDIEVGEGLRFDLWMFRAGEPVYSADFKVTNFTFTGRSDNNQRDYSITSSTGETLTEETNFDPENFQVDTPKRAFTPGTGIDFNWNRIGTGGAIMALETLTLQISNVVYQETKFTSNGTPYRFLDRYYPGLTTDTDYTAADLADSDGDGHSAWEEYLAGTNPIDANSSLTIRRILKGGRPGQLLLSWSSVSGKSYRIYLSDTLTEADWTLVDFGIVASATETDRVVTIDGYPRFLRIAVE